MPTKLLTKEMREVIDRLGHLDAELGPFAPKIREQTELRSQIRKWFDDEPAAAAMQADGVKFSAVIGPMRNEGFIRDKVALLSRLGRKVFLEHAEIAKGVLEGLLRPGELPTFWGESPTGARSVKTVVRVAKAA